MDPMRLEHWRTRLARAESPRWWAPWFGARGFTSGDRWNARTLNGCLLWEAGALLGTGYRVVKDALVGGSAMIYGIEADFMHGVRTDRFALVRDAIGRMEATLPKIAAALEKERAPVRDPLWVEFEDTLATPPAPAPVSR